MSRGQLREASTLSTAVLRYHIWEFADDVEPVGVELICRYAEFFDEEIEGDYDTILAEHLKKEF